MMLLNLPVNLVLPLFAQASQVAPDYTRQWVVLGFSVLVALVALVMFSYNTKAGIIARATTKEAVRQPVFLLALGLESFFLVLNTFLPFFSLGEDVKMLMSCGLETILISSLLIAVWTASTSVADEIEGKTAMTLLSKPITRQQFIIGKYVGILQTLIFYIVPVSLVFLALIYYKVGYDAKESSKEIPETAEVLAVVLSVVPALFMVCLEVAVLTAISVAISTRLPMVVNLSTCFAIYVVANLVPKLVESGVVRLELVAFMGRLIATVLPALDLLNTQGAVATGQTIPPIYLATAAVYSACYAAAAILVAFISFEDRDLA